MAPVHPRLHPERDNSLKAKLKVLEGFSSPLSCSIAVKTCQGKSVKAPEQLLYAARKAGTKQFTNSCSYKRPHYHIVYSNNVFIQTASPPCRIYF